MLTIYLIRLVAPLILFVMRIFEIVCEIINLFFGRNIALSAASLIHALLWRLIMAIARQGTKAEYRRLTSLDIKAVAKRCSLKSSGFSRDCLKIGHEPAGVEDSTGLENYAGKLPEKVLKKLSDLDVRQGVGYDLTQDEGAVMAALFGWKDWHRSPTNPAVTRVILKWLANRKSDAPLKVLDIGAGNCSSTHRLAEMLPPQTQFIASDISPAMLLLGMRRLAENSNLDFKLAIIDGMNLPFKDYSFDLVVNFGSICQMPSPKQAMAEMLRVAMPGGLCICRDERGVDPGRLSILERTWLKRFDKEKIPLKDLPEKIVAFDLTLFDELFFALSFEKPHD